MKRSFTVFTYILISFLLLLFLAADSGLHCQRDGTAYAASDDSGDDYDDPDTISSETETELPDTTPNFTPVPTDSSSDNNKDSYNTVVSYDD